jgi:hypothetical protein
MIWRKTQKPLVVSGRPRVNLLPPEEMENRARKGLRMRWLGAFFATLAVVGLISGTGVLWTMQANGERAAVEESSQQLLAELAKYSDIAATQSDVLILEDLRVAAGSNDLNWSSLTAEIKAALPSGVKLVGFSLAPGAAPKAGVEASAQVGISGKLTFWANRTVTQSETVAKLRTVPGFLSVDAGELAADGAGGGYTFAVTFSADQTRYTGKFGRTGGK